MYYDYVMNDFWRRVEKLRKAQNKSLRWVSIKMGYSYSTVFHWRERGSDLNYDEVSKLAEALNVSVNYLRGIENINEEGGLELSSKVRLELFGTVNNMTEEQVKKLLSYAQYLDKVEKKD